MIPHSVVCCCSQHDISVFYQSNTNDTGPVSLVRYPANVMSPQCWPRILTTWCVLTLCVVRKRSSNWSTIQSCVFLAPESLVHVLRWSPRGSSWNFLQPQVVIGFSSITGIWAPIDVEKNVCQRLADQDSSRRWVLICPSQLIGLKKRIQLGASPSWDSRPAISVVRTDSSTVTTIRCRERKLDPEVLPMKQDLFSNLELRRNDSNIIIGGRALIPHKGSLNEEVNLRKWETLTYDWDCVQTSLQSYCVRHLEWMSRRSTIGGDSHEDESRRSSLGNHNFWRSWGKAPSKATKCDVVV
jgi:hypothetical protein